MPTLEELQAGDIAITYIENVASLHLANILFHCNERQQVILNNIAKFEFEIPALPEDAFVEMQSALETGFIEIVRTHLSALLAQSRHDALQLIEQYSLNENSIENLKRLAIAIESINEQIRAETKSTLIEIDRLVQLASFQTLIYEADERNQFLNLKSVIGGYPTESQLTELKNSVVFYIKNAVKTRFSYLLDQSKNEALQLLENVSGGDSFDCLEGLIDAFASINEKICTETKNTLIEIDRLAQLASFQTLIYEAEERNQFLSLKSIIVGHPTESQLTELKNSVVFYIKNIIKTRFSYLLDQSKNEALQLLENVPEVDPVDCLEGLIGAFASINAQIITGVTATLSEMERLAETPAFFAIINSTERDDFLGLRSIVYSPPTEGQLFELKSSGVCFVKNAIESRLASVFNMAGIRQFLISNNYEPVFQFEEPETFEQIDALLSSAVTLLTPIVEDICLFIERSVMNIRNILYSNLFIGQKAFEFKRSLNSKLLVINKCTTFLGNPSPYQKINQFLENLSLIDNIISMLLIDATTIPKQLATLSEAHIGYDIPNVIEWENGHPAGLRSYAYGNEQIWGFIPSNLASQSNFIDSERSICISFPVGIMPLGRFQIDLTPDSVFGDWIRWLAGGFIFRQRPTNAIQIPKLPERLTDFIKVHVIAQWSGKVGLDAVIFSANSATNTDRENCELFFSNVVTN